MNTILQSTWNQILVTLVLVGAVFALGAYTNLTWQEARYASDQIATISVQGEGEVVAVPDIGTFQFSIVEEAETVAQAQSAAAEINNEILAYLQETADVDESDIKTLHYNVNPRYEFHRGVCPAGQPCPPEGERTLVGYEVRQTLQVQIRDTGEAGELIVGVGERGASNISSLQFTIDDDSAYRDEARAEAIAAAAERARALADTLGVQLVRIVDFSESGVGRPDQYRAQMESMDVLGMGGAEAPSMPVGENTIRRSVTVTYEIR